MQDFRIRAHDVVRISRLKKIIMIHNKYTESGLIYPPFLPLRII